MGEPETGLTAPATTSTALAAYNWTRDQVDLIKRTVAKGTSDDELALFLHVCKRTGLDPLARQIYAIMRRSKEGDKWVEKMVIQTGIDGLRLQAERTGKFRGFGPTEWCGDDGIWRDVWLRFDVPPSAARVTVLRAEVDSPEAISIPGLALYREYVQTNSSGEPTQRWKSGPAGQLAKCAEALALRRAFPAELAGLVAAEEMGASNTPQEAPKVVQPTRKSEKAKPAPAANLSASLENPWTGDLDDVKANPEGKYWMLEGDQGKAKFFTDQVDIKDRAASAMSNAQQVRIEWKRTPAGNAHVETLAIVMDA